MFKNPFSFEGRIRRKEYVFTYLIYIAFAMVWGFLSEINTAFGYLGILFIPLIWFMLAQGAKRCHDRDNSGWYQLIPFYGLWMLFGDSDDGENRFGPNPKGIGNNSSAGEHLIEDQV